MIAYIITCIPSGKKYVGISKHSIPEIRWKQHMAQAKKGNKQLLYRAIDKYGIDSFTIEHVASARSWSDLCAVERELIAQHKTFWFGGNGYNMTIGGDGVIGHIFSKETREQMGASRRGKKLSPEHCAKIVVIRTGRTHTEETKAKISATKKGVRLSDSTRERMSLTRTGKPGVIHTDATKRRLSEANLGKPLSAERREAQRLGWQRMSEEEKLASSARRSAAQLLKWRKKKEKENSSSDTFGTSVMRKSLFIGACLCAFSFHAHAQVIVNDPPAMIQWGMSIANEVKSYALQAKTYVGDQLSWAVQGQQYFRQGQQYLVEATQLAGFIHNPNIGAAMGLMNRAGLGNSLPVSPYAVMGLVNGSSYSAGGMPNVNGILGTLASFSTQSYNQNHIYSPTDGSWNSQQLINNGNAIYGVQAASLAAYGDIKAHEAAQQGLRDRLATAVDPKDVYDIQAQIGLENMWTANQHASLTALQITANTQDQAREQRDNESLNKGIDDFLAQAKAAGRGL